MYSHLTGQDESAPTTRAQLYTPEDAIRLRAFFICEQRVASGIDSTAESDWYQAELEESPTL